jgi:hypothetical protein
MVIWPNIGKEFMRPLVPVTAASRKATFHACEADQSRLLQGRDRRSRASVQSLDGGFGLQCRPGSVDLDTLAFDEIMEVA